LVSRVVRSYIPVTGGGFRSTFFDKKIDANMNSNELAKYIEETDGMGKSWLLVQLRLQKLAEAKPNLSSEEYIVRLEDIHRDMMNLGEWWSGMESEVF
jgi:hypothetical protein